VFFAALWFNRFDLSVKSRGRQIWPKEVTLFMEIEQIIKQVDWLDEEHRKDRTRLGAIEERMSAVEGNVQPLPHQIKDLSGEVTRMTALLSRMDRFDENMLQVRVETKQYFEELERQIKKQAEESEKVRRVELRALDSSLVELRKELEPIGELRRGMKMRVDEESRLSRLIDEVRSRMETLRRSDEEYTRTFRLLDDGRRQDAKRVTDLQGEVSAVRKRVDEDRGKIELTGNSLKKVETRMNELAVVETERREQQTAFIEQQALAQVERERIWKDWSARFEVIESSTKDIEANLQALDSTNRAVKRTQTQVEDLAGKVERRINEIAEIQRLAEERFRQEWVTFKADDQKRWTNYTLTLEEQRSESGRLYEKLTERVTRLEDEIAEVHDLFHQANEQTEKRLQTLLALAHDWVSTYERNSGRAR
jgi:chromosome segregation ATPase